VWPKLLQNISETPVLGRVAQTTAKYIRITSPYRVAQTTAKHIRIASPYRVAQTAAKHTILNGQYLI
jgi:hypothetical protein